MLLIVADDIHYSHILCDSSGKRASKILIAFPRRRGTRVGAGVPPTAVSLDVSLLDMLPRNAGYADRFISKMGGPELLFKTIAEF
jgi:hypothetical protein